MAKVAKSYWEKIWAPRSPPASDKDRSAFLSNENKRVEPSLIPTPSLASGEAAIARSKNTSPGPDGVPFSAWRAAPDLAAPLLFGALLLLLEGKAPLKGFNHAILFLLPKKATGLVADTRPISVTNTDNRLLASVAPHSDASHP